MNGYQNNHQTNKNETYTYEYLRVSISEYILSNAADNDDDG